jgi:hypothetical protein
MDSMKHQPNYRNWLNHSMNSWFCADLELVLHEANSDCDPISRNIIIEGKTTANCSLYDKHFIWASTRPISFSIWDEITKFSIRRRKAWFIKKSHSNNLIQTTYRMPIRSHQGKAFRPVPVLCTRWSLAMLLNFKIVLQFQLQSFEIFVLQILLFFNKKTWH